MRMLVCLSSGEENKATLRYARRLSQQLGAEVTLLHVKPPFFEHSKGYYDDRRKESVRNELDAQPPSEEQFLNEPRVFLDQKGIEADIQVRESEQIVDTILKVAQEVDADLIVLGATQHRTLEQIFQPGISNRVMKNAQRPVLIVPPSKERVDAVVENG